MGTNIKMSLMPKGINKIIYNPGVSISTPEYVYCDGMENNAQFVEWNNSSASNFPRELPNKMILNSTYYVCSKYIAV